MIEKYIYGVWVCAYIHETIHNYSIVAYVAWIYHDFYRHPIQVMENVAK